jgi:hypothetical protein
VKINAIPHNLVWRVFKLFVSIGELINGFSPDIDRVATITIVEEEYCVSCSFISTNVK